MSLTARQQKWRKVAAANPRGFVEAKIHIPDLVGREVPLKYSFDQARVSEKKKELHKLGVPVRLWLLKARRAYITTEESVENYAFAYGNANARVGVIAHLEDRAKEILNNFRIYDDSLKRYDPELVLEKSKDSVFGLKFAETNSQILIATAMNPVKVRGDGLHRVHLSEAAYFYNQFDEVMKEIGPTVPAVAGSQVVIETTGSQIGSQPYLHWLDSKLGKNEFEAMFLCWLDNPHRTRPFKSEKEKHEIFARIAETEPRLAELNAFHKLTPEQIHESWYMYHFQAKNDFQFFCQEFPYSEEMAWTAGGDSYFGVQELQYAHPEHPEHIYLVDQHYMRRLFKDPSELRRVEHVEDYTILPQLKVWKLPQKGAKYVIGGDSSFGDASGDYSAGYVIDIKTREMMAAYHGLLRPDEAACMMVSLCRMYNNALAGPETNPGGGGYEALNCIQRLGYHHIYSWRHRDGYRGIENSQSLGWYTHGRSRPIMLGELRKTFMDTVRTRIADYGLFRDQRDENFRHWKRWHTDSKRQLS